MRFPEVSTVTYLEAAGAPTAGARQDEEGDEQGADVCDGEPHDRYWRLGCILPRAAGWKMRFHLQDMSFHLQDERCGQGRAVC